MDDSHWQVNKEVDLVVTKTGDTFLRQPGQKGVITKVARKYVTAEFSGPGLHTHSEQFLKENGRSPSQHGISSIVYPGDKPVVLPEDFLPRKCCGCGGRHD